MLPVLNKNFCFSPWTHLDIKPQGTMSPCCKFRNEHYDQQLNVQNNTIDEYVNSQFLNEIKNDFRQGLWPKGCERCRYDEENNIPSKRQLDYQRWKRYYDSYQEVDGFITSGIALGNTCNLKCITCNSIASSRWRKEFQQIYHIDYPRVDFLGAHFEEQFSKVTKNILHLDIGGGEPFLNNADTLKKMLKGYIDSGRSAYISLHYTTNGQVFPDAEWWELWQYFQTVELQLSIDGINKMYEYIRYLASWDLFVTNARKYIEAEKKLNNFKLSVSHTVSAYNIYYLDNFYTWCLEFGLPKPWLGRVHHPEHMRPEVWDLETKTEISKHLANSRYAEVRVWASTLLNNTLDKFNEFCNYTKQHDEYRGTNFKNTFPEIAEIAFGKR